MIAELKLTSEELLILSGYLSETVDSMRRKAFEMKVLDGDVSRSNGMLWDSDTLDRILGKVRSAEPKDPRPPLAEVKVETLDSLSQKWWDQEG